MRKLLPILAFYKEIVSEDLTIVLAKQTQQDQENHNLVQQIVSFFIFLNKIKYKLRFFVLFYFFLFFSCNTQTKETTKYERVDSLLFVFNKEPIKSEKKKILGKIHNEIKTQDLDSVSLLYYEKLTDKAFEIEDFEFYYELYNEIEKKAIIAKDTLTLIETECNKATYFLIKYDYNNTYYYLNKAEKLSLSSKNKKFLSFIYTNKAKILDAYKNHILAESFAFKSLNYIDDRKGKADEYLYESYMTISKCLFYQNKLDESLIYYLKTLEVAYKLKDDLYYKSNIAHTLNDIASIYIKKKNFNKAIAYINSGLAIDNFKKTDQNIFCYLTNNLGYSKLNLNDNTAKKHFIESLEIAKQTKNIFAINTSNLYLSEYYLKYNNIPKAFFHANEVLQATDKNKLNDDKLKALLLLAKANPNEATNYFENYQKLSDRLINNERLTRDKFARIEFETNEIISEKDIIQKEKESILQKLWSVSSIAALIILIVLLFYFIKSRNLKNKELKFIQEQQNSKEEIYDLMLNQQHRIEEGKYLEKNRISQELHDGVMGKLMAIRLNLFILKKKQDTETIEKCLPFIDDIQNIEKEIRQISHDLNQNLFNDNVTFISIVENLFTMIKGHSDIEFNLNIDERIDWEVINNNIKINIYRIIQEALQNIDKYAQATKVNINMFKKENEIHITIVDNGIGFKPDTNKKGIGLENMKKRMTEINGTFLIETIINQGTTINLIF